MAVRQIKQPAAVAQIVFNATLSLAHSEASELLLVYLSRFIGAAFHELERAPSLPEGQQASTAVQIRHVSANMTASSSQS